MNIIKIAISAIFLVVLMALAFALLESFFVHIIIKIYEITYLNSLQYYQILGLSFILMIFRNRIKILDENKPVKEFFSEIISLSLNRFFRILFT